MAEEARIGRLEPNRTYKVNSITVDCRGRSRRGGECRIYLELAERDPITGAEAVEGYYDVREVALSPTLSVNLDSGSNYLRSNFGIPMRCRVEVTLAEGRKASIICSR